MASQNHDIHATSDWRALYPFGSHYLDIDGLAYHYLDECENKAGDDLPVLLMVHGNPTWSFYWRELIPKFRDRYRVVVPDHIGCGLSDKPGRDAYPFTLARRVEDLCRLVEALELRNVTLVAHDWGGAIGMGAAAAMSERFERFVLLNTAAFRSRRIPLRINVCRLPLLGRLGVQGFNLFARAAIRMAVRRPERMTAAVKSGFLAPYDSWPHRTAVQQFVLDIPLRPKHPSYAKLEEIEAVLPRLADRPVCLIWGMKDWCFTPHFLERFEEFFPSAQSHRLEEAGHYVVQDSPEEVAAAMEGFLSGTADFRLKTSDS
ncbi:MAG: alpha/beta fold hydrolase [Pirellulales bacterium]|nr:alpha/beta fold hydrolase [Pirellulales bacterium]